MRGFPGNISPEYSAKVRMAGAQLCSVLPPVSAQSTSFSNSMPTFRLYSTARSMCSAKSGSSFCQSSSQCRSRALMSIRALTEQESVRMVDERLVPHVISISTIFAAGMFSSPPRSATI